MQAFLFLWYKVQNISKIGLYEPQPSGWSFLFVTNLSLMIPGKPGYYLYQYMIEET